MKKAARTIVANPEKEQTDKTINNLLFGTDQAGTEILEHEDVTTIMNEFDPNYKERYKDYVGKPKATKKAKEVVVDGVCAMIERVHFDSGTGKRTSKARKQYFNEKAWKQFLATKEANGYTVTEIVSIPKGYPTEAPKPKSK